MSRRMQKDGSWVERIDTKDGEGKVQSETRKMAAGCGCKRLPQSKGNTPAAATAVKQPTSSAHSRTQAAAAASAKACKSTCGRCGRKHAAASMKPAPCEDSQLAVGNRVEVMVLNRHGKATGMWRRAVVTGRPQHTAGGWTVGQYHLSDEHGEPIQPALASGIQRHHLRCMPNNARVSPRSDLWKRIAQQAAAVARMKQQAANKPSGCRALGGVGKQTAASKVAASPSTATQTEPKAAAHDRINKPAHGLPFRGVNPPAGADTQPRHEKVIQSQQREINELKAKLQHTRSNLRLLLD